MKILHTSDWHLGHRLYEYDRTEEQQNMLDQMANIVAQEHPDVFVLAGDVFDTSAPSSATHKMYVQSMLNIRRANEKMVIVVIAGNHDSAAKLDMDSPIWRELNVQTLCYIDKEHLEKLIIEIPDKGYVIAVPYCYERMMPERLWQDLQDKVAERNTNHLPVVMMAHTTVAGMDYTGHTQQNTAIGNIESISVENMGDGYDYLALGHIHKPQYVHSGKHNVCYSGSPIAVSFDEKYEHSVRVVELESGKTPEVKTIPIRNIRPLINIPAEGFKPWEEVKELLEKLDDNLHAYIRLNVEVEGHAPTSATDTANEIATRKNSYFCRINEKQKTTDGQTNNTNTVMTIDELKALSPIEMAEQYMKRIGRTMTEEMREVIQEAVTQVESDERNH